jgi:hypothetical protein
MPSFRIQQMETQVLFFELSEIFFHIFSLFLLSLVFCLFVCLFVFAVPFAYIYLASELLPGLALDHNPLTFASRVGEIT